MFNYLLVMDATSNFTICLLHTVYHSKLRYEKIRITLFIPEGPRSKQGKHNHYVDIHKAMQEMIDFFKPNMSKASVRPKSVGTMSVAVAVAVHPQTE